MGQDYLIAHGSPLDEDAYLLHPREALQAFDALRPGGAARPDGQRHELCFFGHTHLPEGYELDETANA